MKNLLKSYGIITFVAVIGFSLVSCASLGIGVSPFVGTWTWYDEGISIGGTYIINADSTYSVTMTVNRETDDERAGVIETGTWAKGTWETTGKGSDIINNTTIVFTKSDGSRYTGRLAFNKLTIEGNTFTKQETE